MDRRKGVTRKDMAGRFDLEEFELASRPRCVSLTYHQQSHMMYDATGHVSQLESSLVSLQNSRQALAFQRSQFHLASVRSCGLPLSLCL
jgi:hypothetical protein